jgi:8-oxo-dGTP diphosphatase
MTESPRSTDYTQIDWTTWSPEDRATLLFIIQNDKILLIRKKRGLGAGKINGPGGRIEAGETPLEAAIREVEEELVITPDTIAKRGTLSFQFVDGYSLFCTVYTANNFTGTPTETDEADPLWYPLDKIPYAEMWADDIIWMPKMLEGHDFSGRFLFDGDMMLGHQIDFISCT